jgi:cyclophilin family peptidyl-prolyl cis-trans isomerase
MSTQAAANNRVRFATALGFINVVLFKKDVPLTIANFKHYADEGAYDGTFFHRSARTDFKIIQGGGYNVVNGDEIGKVHSHDPIADERARQNDKGTIAMANTGAVNSSSNQWYFNIADNSSAFDFRFSVFGVVMDDASQKTIEAINNLTIVDADGGGTEQFGELPVRDPAAGPQRAINIPGDLPFVTRVAMQVDAVRTPGTGAAPASASTARVSRSQAVTPAAAPAVAAFSIKRVSKERVFD